MVESVSVCSTPQESPQTSCPGLHTLTAPMRSRRFAGCARPPRRLASARVRRCRARARNKNPSVGESRTIAPRPLPGELPVLYPSAQTCSDWRMPGPRSSARSSSSDDRDPSLTLQQDLASARVLQNVSAGLGNHDRDLLGADFIETRSRPCRARPRRASAVWLASSIAIRTDSPAFHFHLRIDTWCLRRACDEISNS